LGAPKRFAHILQGSFAGDQLDTARFNLLLAPPHFRELGPLQVRVRDRADAFHQPLRQREPEFRRQGQRIFKNLFQGSSHEDNLHHIGPR
jgi:hypothetical protein